MKLKADPFVTLAFLAVWLLAVHTVEDHAMISIPTDRCQEIIIKK